MIFKKIKYRLFTLESAVKSLQNKMDDVLGEKTYRNLGKASGWIGSMRATTLEEDINALIDYLGIERELVREKIIFKKKKGKK